MSVPALFYLYTQPTVQFSAGAPGLHPEVKESVWREDRMPQRLAGHLPAEGICATAP